MQARGPIDDAFRSLLKAAGAAIVSYIPNNAYLVRASGAVARQLQADPRTQSVLPYEPYYKLKPSLLKLAVAQEPLPDNSVLNLLLFADAREQTLADLENLGVEVLGEDRSPFGPVVRVLPPVESLPLLAGLPGVQEVELALARVPANDLSRVRIGVSTDTLVPTNYLGLTGTNVLVNVNDSGVDADASGFDAAGPGGESTNALVDPNGHGTHVAGIIASSGEQSSTVDQCRGPGRPVCRHQYPIPRQGAGGEALRPAGRDDDQALYGRGDPDLALRRRFAGGGRADQRLHLEQQLELRRQRLPDLRPPCRQLRCRGARRPAHRVGLPAAADGLFRRQRGRRRQQRDGSGRGDTIQSPGTAKNVITVGAIEQLRNITNESWKCSTVQRRPIPASPTSRGWA